MRMSQLFSRTRRELPAESDSVCQQLLIRAGYLHESSPGSYVQLPLGRRTLQRLETSIATALEAIGGQKINLPLLTTQAAFEAVVAQLAREQIHSYRQLPALLYSISPRRLEENRIRGEGLLRLRQLTQLSAYNMDSNLEQSAENYQKVAAAFQTRFERWSLPVERASAGFDASGKTGHTFIQLTPAGDATVLICGSCGYQAERSSARAHKLFPPPEPSLPLELVSTPTASTIESLAELLGVPTARTAKAVFLMASPETSEIPSGQPVEEAFVFVVVRGDTEVNETKLANVVQARALRPATEAEIRRVGATPGYASPVGLRGVQVVVDELIPKSPNLVAGANRDGYHLMNVNYERDYNAEQVADITTARDGDRCPECKSRLRAERGVILGRSIQYGAGWAATAGCAFLDEAGKSRPLWFAAHHFGLEHLLAGIAETHHDAHGLRLPAGAAPFSLHVVALAGKSGQPSTAATELTDRLEAAGFEVLFDDRVESPGVKFKDADLIGIPLRLTISERSLSQDCIELKPRGGEAVLIPLNEALETISGMIVK
ncbi:MAG: YbaK/EbsC family protein [Anaerolineaceae bacterium]|nr:YbaK/EbsC family protein [Anaerolineaceae bacterium]